MSNVRHHMPNVFFDVLLTKKVNYLKLLNQLSLVTMSESIHEEIAAEFENDPEVMKWLDSPIQIQLRRMISERAHVSLEDMKGLVQMLEEGGEEGHQQAIIKLNTFIRRKEILQRLEGVNREKGSAQ